MKMNSTMSFERGEGLSERMRMIGTKTCDGQLFGPVLARDFSWQTRPFNLHAVFLMILGQER
jgi:hypothetical protein